MLEHGRGELQFLKLGERNSIPYMFYNKHHFILSLIMAKFLK